MTCILTHELTHSERTSLTAKPDQSGKKNPIQAIASTVSYLQKYTLLAITGLAAQGMDTDGNGGCEDPEYINPDQQTFINDRVQEIYGTEKEHLFWNWLKVKTAEEITVDMYDKAISGLDKAQLKKESIREPGEEG